MQAPLHRPGQLPSTTSWLLAAGLLLGLLGLGCWARLALAPQAQAGPCSPAPPAAQVVPASWRVAAP